MRPMLHHPRRFAQSGFTLVEMAIVLVIIGLLLGGVLKGQELIENARVKDVANMMNGITAAYNSYIDRYGRLPGDDGPLTGTGNIRARGGSWGVVTDAGDYDGVVEINMGDTFSTASGENIAFWQHLRAAGFIKGNPADTGANALPKSPWGGLVGVTNSNAQGRSQNTLLVCMQNVPGKAALALDRQLDDAAPHTGSVRATQGSNANPTSGVIYSYVESQTYTICKDI